MEPASTFEPGKPREQRNGEHGGERHVGGRGPSKADDGGARSGHERGVELRSGTKAPEKKEHGEQHGSGIHRRRKARGPVAHAEDGIRDYGLPVVKNGLFQPNLAGEHWGDPVMPGKHLARDLGVARLVSAHQPKRIQSEEEKEGAEQRKREELADSR